MIHSLEVQTTPSSLRTSFPSYLPIASVQGVKVDVVSIQLVSRIFVFVMLDGQVITVQQVWIICLLIRENPNCNT